MKPILRYLYRLLTTPIIEEYDRKHKKAQDDFQKQLPFRTRWDHVRARKKLAKVQKQLNAEMVFKINRYNWLNRLL